ncbi:transcriptional regulator [Streptococcus parauberis]|nr:transcriptional regulator [Streptococcus parauberis]QBX27674.1 transcriptional activator [Streptococcus phage Javan406]
MSKLSNSQLKAFDEWLFDYREIDRKIAIRKLELQSSVNDDSNIGGGKPNIVSKPTENIISKWSSDGQITSYENFRDRVLEVRDQLDEELNAIFDLRWGVGSKNTWEEIAHKKHISRASIYRKRRHILTLFGKKIGKL